MTRALLISSLLLWAAGERPADTRAGKPERVLIPAGAFIKGSNRGADDERPQSKRTLPAFKIDRTEVTRAMYARCVASHRCPKPVIDLTSDPELPVTNVNWHEARAFCAYAGGRLPSEDEWEKAARGSDGREFPWGNDLDCSHANWGNFESEGPCAGKGPGKPIAVGNYPQGVSPYGIHDMAGNVWEWTADKYDRDPTRRVVRGGSCCSYFVEPRSANRNAWDPEHRDGDLGFRCAAR